VNNQVEGSSSDSYPVGGAVFGLYCVSVRELVIGKKVRWSQRKAGYLVFMLLDWESSLSTRVEVS